MSTQQYIQDKYFTMFEIIAKLDAGIKHGTIKDLNQVRELIAPVTFRPQPTRGCAPTNPATLLAKGEAL